MNIKNLLFNVYHALAMHSLQSAILFYQLCPSVCPSRYSIVSKRVLILYVFERLIGALP